MARYRPRFGIIRLAPSFLVRAAPRAIRLPAYYFGSEFPLPNSGIECIAGSGCVRCRSENVTTLDSARRSSGGNLRSNKTQVPYSDCCSEPGPHAELAEDMLQMFLYGARTDTQAGANLRVGLSASDPKQNVRFPGRQAESPEGGNGGGLRRMQSPCRP